MTHLGVRILAGILWAAAMALLITGSAAGALEHQLVLFAWSMFLCALAITVTVLLFVQYVIELESERNAQITADAVGHVVGQVLVELAGDTGVGKSSA